MLKHDSFFAKTIQRELYSGKISGVFAAVDEACGTHVQFRLSETPCFFPKALIDRMAEDGKELIRQLVGNPAYLAKSELAVPAEFKVPNEPEHPMFVQVDFGLVRDAARRVAAEAGGVAGVSFSVCLSGAVGGGLHRGLRACGFRLPAFGFRSAGSDFGTRTSDSRLKYLLSGLETSSYRELLRRAIVADHDPENVILMEIDPAASEDVAGFSAHGEDVGGADGRHSSTFKKDGSRLYYERGGKRVPIERIYNRAIVDELERKNVKLNFDWRDELEVEWAGHPNWYFRISKFSIPYLRHESVPKTWFLDRSDGKERFLAIWRIMF